MLLNRIEYLLMNNPIRAAIQCGWEARRLLAMGGPMNGGRALEIGCGRGVGIQIILDTFGASHVDAFDLDPRMVRAAERRHRHRADRVKVWQGDATHVNQADAHYDAVFDFGIIHHVPSWRDAISEVWRVLKPGGRFYAEEVFDRFINGFPWRWLLKHPREDRFDAAGFSAALAAALSGAGRGRKRWILWVVHRGQTTGGVTNGCTRGGVRVGDDGWVARAARVTRVVHLPDVQFSKPRFARVVATSLRRWRDRCQIAPVEVASVASTSRRKKLPFDAAVDSTSRS